MFPTVSDFHYFCQGSSGSCVENFQVMPLMKTHLSRLSVNSYWLMSETNRQNDLESRIGRCSVCEVPANIINLHSQTDQVWYYSIINYELELISYWYFSFSFHHVHQDGRPFGLVTVTVTSVKALDLLVAVFRTIGQYLTMVHDNDSIIYLGRNQWLNVEQIIIAKTLTISVSTDGSAPTLILRTICK